MTPQTADFASWYNEPVTKARLAMPALDLRTEMARDLAAIPVVRGEKTPGERLAGAVRTFTIEGMMLDGKALQCGIPHYLGMNFARAFNIQYAGESGRLALCHTRFRPRSRYPRSCW